MLLARVSFSMQVPGAGAMLLNTLPVSVRSVISSFSGNLLALLTAWHLCPLDGCETLWQVFLQQTCSMLWSGLLQVYQQWESH